MLNPKRIMEVLSKHQVEFVLIGGVAASLHGCPEQTYDVDILYNSTDDNKERLLSALGELEARWDNPLTASILDTQRVFALNTRMGDLDIFSSIPGIGNYEDALQYRESASFADVEVEMLNLNGWLKAKEAVLDTERNPRKLGAFEYMKALKEQLDQGMGL